MGYLSCNAHSAIATCHPHFRKPIPIRHFPYSDLLAAANGFSQDNFLGRGSHGRVYKARLDGGKVVGAVKISKQNCSSAGENEMEILSQVASERVVKLIGFSRDPNGNKVIVVEYMPNGSLHDLLHKVKKPPSWKRRLRYALQVAKGLRDLHSSNPPVIHRDVKSSNVLIDRNGNARLADFGLALRGHVEDARVNRTPPAGTLGYLDPCYLAPEDLTSKSDVFSFGILLLEILTGRNAIDVNFTPPSLLHWAIPSIKLRDFAPIFDRRIGPPPELLSRLALLAASCVRSTAAKRPSMAEVVECLHLARKRLRATPAVWSSLRRRVVESPVAVAAWEECESENDGSEERVKSGNRRKGKVSSVSGVGYGSVVSNNYDKGMRSKSIGSGSGWVKMQQAQQSQHEHGHGHGHGRRKVMRLKKSKSMGVLQGFMYGENSNDAICSAMAKLVVTDKLEKKPLVQMKESLEE